MKKILLFLCIAMLWGGCTPKQAITNDTLYVSILPLRSVVQAIVGNDFPIEVLVPAGASPETFEPTARQYVALNRAQLVFGTGLLDFEQNLLTKLPDTTKVINLSRGVDVIAGTCSHSTHNHSHGVDPHIWTSPRELQKMAANAYDAIHRLYPDSIKYTTNYQQLISDLQQLDTQVATKIAASGITYFLIYHPALTYYARDYGVQQEAIEVEGKDPTAKRLSALIRQARADGVKRIFYQRQFPASTVETIARDMDAEYIEIDPLREDIIVNINEITDLITARR